MKAYIYIEIFNKSIYIYCIARSCNDTVRISNFIVRRCGEFIRQKAPRDKNYALVHSRRVGREGKKNFPRIRLVFTKYDISIASHLLNNDASRVVVNRGARREDNNKGWGGGGEKENWNFQSSRGT